MNIHRIKEPFIFTIFGASGDLAKIKLFPAFYSLAEQKRLPANFYIVGFARTPKTQKQFRAEFSKSIKSVVGKDLDKKSLKNWKNMFTTSQVNTPTSPALKSTAAI